MFKNYDMKTVWWKESSSSAVVINALPKNKDVCKVFQNAHVFQLERYNYGLTSPSEINRN